MWEEQDKQQNELTNSQENNQNQNESSVPTDSYHYSNTQTNNSGYSNAQAAANQQEMGLNSSFGCNPPGSPYGNNYGNYASLQQPSFGQHSEKGKRKKKSHPILKKAAGITAAAFLFGAVSGSTIFGIGLITKQISPAQGTEAATIAQTPTLPALPSSSTNHDNSSVVTTAMNDVSAIVEKAMPSVVAITSITQYQTQNWFGQSQIYEGKGSGSGIVIGESDTELLIVTNNHVVEGAKTLTVVFNDDENVEANIKGTDSENDLAVIAVPLDKIPDDTKSQISVAALGNSDELKVGQGVIAIGNALGYGQSVTVGYISALNREVKTDQQTTRNLLQTDAAINPGNSGGALLNMQGEVVGINSAKYSSTEVEGMGYAIPISKVYDIIGDLMTKKTRVQVDQDKQGYLGIQGIDVDSNSSNLYGMPQGIFVYKIMEDGMAAASDLKEKDIITKFDGQSVRSMSELKNMLTYYAGGDKIMLTVQTLQDGQYVEHDVEIVLGTRPAEENIN